MPQLFSKLSASRTTSIQARIAADIVGLMNCATRGARLPIPASSQAASSVLNYGNPPLSPLGSTRIDPNRLAGHIRDALIQFEPRLDPNGLRVAARTDTDRVDRQHLYFDISANLLTDGSAYRLRIALDYLGTAFSVASA